MPATACNFIKKETLTQVFSSEFWEISKNTFFYRTPPMAAPDEYFFPWQFNSEKHLQQAFFCKGCRPRLAEKYQNLGHDDFPIINPLCWIFLGNVCGGIRYEVPAKLSELKISRSACSFWKAKFPENLLKLKNLFRKSPHSCFWNKFSAGDNKATISTAQEQAKSNL